MGGHQEESNHGILERNTQAHRVTDNLRRLTGSEREERGKVCQVPVFVSPAATQLFSFSSQLLQFSVVQEMQ